MSFTANLTISGKEVRVLHCSYSLYREVDATGKPSSMVHGGKISLEIESTDDNSLFEWMVDQFKTNDGTVTFKKRNQDSKMKELKWEKGYIVEYTEGLDAIGENPMTIHFVVSAEKISVGGASHKNPWPKS
jgi:Hemolysin coregulated protein Hcp (TssD)